jgi:hypothetical protein
MNFCPDEVFAEHSSTHSRNAASGSFVCKLQMKASPTRSSVLGEMILVARSCCIRPL